MSQRKLLVLDLDETLIHASEVELAHPEDFRFGPYFVYRRPHLSEFLKTVLADFDVAVWTSSGETYATAIIEQLFAPGALKFLWSSQRCTTVRDWLSGNYTVIKNLSKLKRLGYALESIIAVDDTPSKYARSYGNLVTVSEFLGDPADAELPLLASYLRSLLPETNVRAIEKRNWRSWVSEHLED